MVHLLLLLLVQQDSHLVRAGKLARVGLVDAAREEARAAIAQAPSSPDAHHLLGDLLARDRWGRWLGKGAEPEAALAELRRAKALDPRHQASRLELARLLAYLPPRQADAAAEYRALRRDFGDGTANLEEAVVLIRLGKFADAIAVAEAAQSLPPTDTARLVFAATAATGNRAELRVRVAALPEAFRKSTLNEASRLLYSERLYAASTMAYEEAIASGWSDDRWLVALRRHQRYEKLLGRADDPVGFVRRQVAQALLTSSGPAFVHALVPLRAQQASMPPEVSIDYLFSQASFTREGEEGLGYRVEMRREDGTGTPAAFYVRRAHGALELVATSDHPAELAALARTAHDAAEDAKAVRWLGWALADMPDRSDSDPLSAHPFRRLFPREDELPTREAIAALMIDDAQHAAEAIPLLSHCKRLPCQAALVIALFTAQRPREALPIAEELSRQYPDSVRAFRWRATALSQLGAIAQLRLLASQRLRAHPDEKDARYWFAEALCLFGDAACERELRQLSDGPNADARDYNQRAWNALFLHTATADDVAAARKAVELSNRRSRPHLNTLAAVLADSGQLEEAHDVLIESWPWMGRQGPMPSDFYVLGRIAEQMGRRAEAIAFYRQEPVPPPGIHWSFAAYLLAQKRLAAMQ